MPPPATDTPPPETEMTEEDSESTEDLPVEDIYEGSEELGLAG